MGLGDVTRARRLTRLTLAIVPLVGVGVAWARSRCRTQPGWRHPSHSVGARTSTTRRAASPRRRRCCSTTTGTPAWRSATGRATSTGSTWQNGSVRPAGAAGRGAPSGSGQGCTIGNPGGGSPATGVNGVEVPGSPPIDSTASVNTNGDLYFGAGNAASPVDGGYYAYSSNGTEVWNQVVTNPATDTAPDGGVQASLSIGRRRVARRRRLAGADDLRAGQRVRRAGDRLAAVLRRQRVLHRRRRRPLRHGLGRLRRRRRVVHRLRLRHALRRRRHAAHLQRPRRPRLQRHHERGDRLLARRRPILPGGAYGIATGTGSFFPGAGDENTVKVYDTKCNQVWSDTLDGSTGGSPALADVQGNGQLAVVEGTVNPDGSGRSGRSTPPRGSRSGTPTSDTPSTGR